MKRNQAKKVAETHKVGFWWDSSASEWVVTEPFESGCAERRLSSKVLQDISEADFILLYIEPVVNSARVAKQQRLANEAAFFGRGS